jgi:hypothetical protein
MLRTSQFICLLVAAAAVTTASAQDTVNLRRAYKVGDTDRYKTVIQVASADNSPIDMTFVTIDKVKEIRADGSTVLGMTVESAVGKFGGQEFPVPAGSGEIAIEMDKDGKVTRQETTGNSMGQILLMARQSQMPTKPLKIGEEAKFETPGGKNGKGKMNGVLTVVGRAKKGDKLPVDCIELKTVAEGLVNGPQGDMKLKVEGKSFIGEETNRLIRSEGAITGLVIPMLGDGPLKYTITRMEADKAADKPTAAAPGK